MQFFILLPALLNDHTMSLLLKYVSRLLMLSMRLIGPPLLPCHLIKDLEEQLVYALYEQRSHEQEILQYSPESSAPKELRDAFCASRVKVNKIEKEIRLLKYSF